jgi:hypothetical protein
MKTYFTAGVLVQYQTEYWPKSHKTIHKLSADMRIYQRERPCGIKECLGKSVDSKEFN